MARLPTESQARTLRILATSIVPAAMGRELAALARRGWVETLDGAPAERERPRGPFPPLRLSSAGWRAVADALDAGVLPAYTLDDFVRNRIEATVDTGDAS